MRTHKRGQRGQAVMLVIIGVVVLVGITGAAVDAGFGYTERRGLQNEADALALAGTQVLGLHATYDPTTLLTVVYTCGQMDARITQALQTVDQRSSVVGNQATRTYTAYYVDVNGTPLVPVGGGAPIQVGSGCTPGVAGIAALVAFGISASVTGTYNTYAMRMFNVNTYTVNAAATAVNRFDVGLNNPYIAPFAIWDSLAAPVHVGGDYTYEVNGYCSFVGPPPAGALDVACAAGSNFKGYMHNVSGGLALGAINTSGGNCFGCDDYTQMANRYAAHAPVIFPIIQVAYGSGSHITLVITGFVAGYMDGPCSNASDQPCSAHLTQVNVPASSLQTGPTNVGINLTQATLIN
ncbi:MAG: pilus assembly protein TadG-related protein [Candidatus Dormibacteria bacterium]